MTVAEKLAAIAANEPKVYSAGGMAEYDKLKATLAADAIPAANTKPADYDALMAQVYMTAASRWDTVTYSGQTVHADRVKGGSFGGDGDFALKVAGKTAQVQLSGKNLLDPESVTEIAYTDNTGNERTRVGTIIDIQGAYTASFTKTANAGSFFFYLCTLDANFVQQWSEYFIADEGGKVVTFTVNKGERLFLYNAYAPSSSGNGYGNIPYTKEQILAWQVQLEAGETATSYEPYCGGIPSPSPRYPQDIQCVKAGTRVRCTGKNLIPINDTGEYVQQYAVDLGDYPLSPGTHTISFFCSSTDTDSDSICVVFQRIGGNSYGKLALKTTDRISITVTDSYYVDVIYFWASNNYGASAGDVGHFWDIQVESGSTATTYEPYVSDEITVPCDLYEGDVWYPLSGKVERRNIVCDSYDPEKWSIESHYVSTTGGLDAGAKIVFSCLSNLPYIEFYEEACDPQPLCAPSGTVNVWQAPVDLAGELTASLLVEKG